MHRNSLLQTVWSSNKPILLGLISLLTLNVLLFLFVFLGISPQLEMKERELASLQQKLRSNENLSTKQLYELGRKDLNYFNTFLPNFKDFSALIGELYRLAEDCHLEVGQISYAQKDVAELNSLSLVLKFSLTGTYDQLKRFVYGLENSKRLIIIDKMSLTSARGRDEGELVSLNLQFTTFFTREEAE